MKKITLQFHIKPTITVLWLLIGMLFVSACSQDNKNQTTTISVSLPSATMAQMKGSANPTSIGGDLTGVDKVNISVYDNNDGSKSTAVNKRLGGGDILAAGGTLKITVLPYTALYVTGEAVDSTGAQLFYGETTVGGLQPGSNAPISLSLQSVAQKPAVSGIVTTAGSLGTVQPGSAIQVLRVVNSVETPITGAQGTVLDANGNYSLNLPDGVSPGSDVIFRVMVDEGGAQPVAMDARFTSLNVNINPVTNAASNLVSFLVNVAETILSDVSVSEILEIERTLNLIAIDLGPQSESNLQTYTDLLTNTLKADLQTAHIASSAVAGGEICGMVTDSSENPLQDITIVVREFDTRLLSARTKTAADGSYCVNVAVTGEYDVLTGYPSKGEYIVGAINSTDSTAASQWWASSTAPGTTLRLDAGKISFVEALSATANFTLPDGARIHGTVIGSSTAEKLAGINVMVRDKTTQFLLVGATTDPNGEYTLNVPPGDYIIEARNNTSKPFASETFTTDGAGSEIRQLGSVVPLVANSDLTADFALADGNLLSGTVIDSQKAVTGVRMFVDDSNGGAVTRFLISQVNGSYKVWLRPASYNVYGYGQTMFADLTQQAQSIAFSAIVAKLPVVVQHNGVNVSGAKIRLYEYNEGPVFKSVDFSKSDGSAMLYSDVNSVHLIEARVEGQEDFSSIIHVGQMQLGNGDTVQLTTGQSAPQVTVALQNAGWLTGSVLDPNGNPLGNSVVGVFAGLPSGGYSRFVATRTDGNGHFELSLPQGNYGTVRITTSDGFSDCQNVPVIDGETTDLLDSYPEGRFCEIVQMPASVRIVSGTVNANGLDAAVDGSIVKLIEVDAAGNQVGDAISFGTVQNGGFQLVVPNSLSADSRYVAVVQTTSGELRARYTDLNSISLSPASTVASDLIAAHISDVAPSEIVEIEHSLQDVELGYDFSGATTLVDYISLLKSNFLSNLETANILTSSYSLGSICGHVQDSANTALSGISIEVRDFHTETLRARATTDTSGDYCVNVPLNGVQDPVSTQVSDGEYLVGAMNYTDKWTAASEWWTAAGNGYERIKGDKITVDSAAAVTADFILEPGARITGTVNAYDANQNLIALPGVDVSVLDSITHFTLADQGALADGSFRINVYPGDYIVEARNSTYRPYASQTYTDLGGSNLRNNGTVITLAAGKSAQVDLTLGSGNLLRVRVAVGADTSTGLGGVPITGVKVLVDQSANSYISAVNLQGSPATRFRVINLDGTYRVWLAPDNYQVFTYGQGEYVDLTLANHDSIFAADVATLPVTVQYKNQPVSGAKLRLYAGIDGYYFWDEAVSRSDGSATLYSDFSGDHRVEARVEEDKPYASVIYGGTQQLYTGAPVNLTQGNTATPITVDLPSGGVISGIIEEYGSPRPRVPNAEVVMLSGQNYFVATRTNSLGQYRLSLPESVYDPAQVNVYDPVNLSIYQDTCLAVDAGIPVITNVATIMDAVTGDGTSCTLTIPSMTINSPTLGDIVFDRSYSLDTSAHPLQFATPTITGWPLAATDVSGNTTTRTYTFTRDIQNGLPVTIMTQTDNGTVAATRTLAVANDNSIYEINNGIPYLYLPATLTGDILWATADGATNSVVGSTVTSPTGFTNTFQIETTYPDQTTRESYWQQYRGVVEEADATGSYSRTDISPP